MSKHGLNLNEIPVTPSRRKKNIAALELQTPRASLRALIKKVFDCYVEVLLKLANE